MAYEPVASSEAELCQYLELAVARRGKIVKHDHAGGVWRVWRDKTDSSQIAAGQVANCIWRHINNQQPHHAKVTYFVPENQDLSNEAMYLICEVRAVAVAPVEDTTEEGNDVDSS